VPLLHTWSLAVEEQFYILYPPFLILVGRWSQKAVVPLIVIGAIVSFALNVYLANQNPLIPFYLAPFRAWELALGALLSLGAVPIVTNRGLRTGLAGLGLGMIAVAVVGYSDKTIFPGVAALLPCLGAALLIHCGSSGPSPIRALLSVRVLVGLGLISYSLYLWHWPLFVFAKYVSIQELSVERNVLLIAISVGLAVLSWRYLETPFRRKAVLVARPRLFGATACATIVLVACGAVFKFGDGLPWRVPAEIVALDAAGHDGNFDSLNCHDMMERAIRADQLCRLGENSIPGTWMVWGDSHAWALKPAIDRWMQENRESGWISSRGGCPPLLGIVRQAWISCKEPNTATLDFIARHRVDKVVFVAAWPGYTTLDLKDEQSGGYSSENTRQVLVRAAETTFAALYERGVKIYIFDWVPGAKKSVPDTLARGKYFNESFDIKLSLKEYNSKNEFFDEVFERNSRFIAGRFSPAKALCPTGTCEILTPEGVPLYSDANHPSSGAVSIFVSILRDGYVSPRGNP
jgi:hypothetical protein